MSNEQIKIIKDLAKQSYALEDQGGLVHKTGDEALTSWRIEAARHGDDDLVDTLDSIQDDGNWDEACEVYERAYEALANPRQVVVDR